jgi:transposase-like protein
MGNKLREKSEKEKIDLVKLCIDKGMPRKEYCKQQGISLATFYNWQKKYRETELKPEGKFVPIVIPAQTKQPAQIIAKNIEIEISYPNGVIVKLNQEMDLPMLRSLIGLM